MPNLFDEILQDYLTGRDPPPEELLDESGTAQAGDLGGSLLRDEALRIPLDTGSDPHLPSELLGRQVKRGKCARRNFIADRGNWLISRT
jgi:hypothetical protein